MTRVFCRLRSKEPQPGKFGILVRIVNGAPPFGNFAAEPHCPIDLSRLAKLCEGAMQTAGLFPTEVQR
jgi:hypothetical protein